MTITLENIGKRFNREWIFKKIKTEIKPLSSVAIIGPNGSGKSTLLQIISGSLLPSSGKIYFKKGNHSIPDDKMFQHLSFCAPYLDIIEDFTLEEFLSFHFSFKRTDSSVSLSELPEGMQLNHAKTKKIKDFSTGMRQRVKLGICFYSESPIVLMDEPTTNLDKTGIDWYLSQIERIIPNKTVIISSNSEDEFSFCENSIDILDYKK